MKQRIRVVGIIKSSDGILILKRSRGRSELPVIWELPTGKIDFGEQPEESIARVLNDNVGVVAKAIKLKDVVTFLALDDSSQLSNLYIVYEIEIADNAKIVPKDRYTAYKFSRDFNGIKLNEASASVIELEVNNRSAQNKSVNREVANSATIYVDGASRGNPGPSGIGYCIFGEDGQIVKRGGEFVGFATSRMAEYYAMREGIEQAIEMGIKTVRFISDSLMVVNQMNGIFQVKNKDIIPIYDDIQRMLAKLDNVVFIHVPRLQNAAADKEANLAIDRHFDENIVK